MKSVDETAWEFSSQTTETKTGWYSPTASNYESGRPDYPADIISEVIARTKLKRSSRLLELGSGPGTATKCFIQLNCTIECVEPNADFVKAAKRRFEHHSNIQIYRSTFEEYRNKSGPFDVIVAATSFHWIKREIAFSKSSSLLRPSGYLVLLWNKELQPIGELGERIREIHDRFEDGKIKFETVTTQIQSLEGIGQWILDSEYFRYLGFVHLVSSVRYTAKQYLEALSSYSPYLAIPDVARKELFVELAHLIETNYGGIVDLQYVTGCHIGQKVT
jgi:SAM-dependent methyltransferase